MDGILTGKQNLNISIDMRKLSAGTYIVQVINERTGEYVQRMVVRK